MKILNRKSLVLMISAVALMGCQKNSGSDTVATRATGPRAVAGTYGATSTLSGQVFTDASYQAQFQDVVVGFLSTDVPAQYVGTVSATGVGGTGVRFGGRVQLSTGSLRTYNSYATISSNSSFSIQVTDSLQATQGAPAIPPFNFTRASGQMSGSQAQITFSDNYGSVTLNGNLNTSTNTFEGTISYDNNVTVEGRTPGSAGNLGNFRIGLCDFFICN